MKKLLKICLFSLTLLFSLVSSVNAVQNSIQAVPADKVWTIKFNAELSADTIISKQNIKVQDSNNNLAEVLINWGEAKDTIIISPPLGGYTPSETYTLTIDQSIKSKDTKTLSKAYTFSFSILPEGNKEQPSLIKKVAENSKAVVLIDIFDDEDLPLGTASGFIVEEDGKLVTNYHVISDAAKLKVTLEDGSEYDVEGVYDCSKIQDIAVLKLKNASNLPVVKLGDSSKVVLADEVIAIGSPVGIKNTVSSGIISGLNRENDFRKGKDLQITAPIAPGSSGGALFNTNSEVIGITYAGMDIGNVGFAIPINEVKPFLKTTKLMTIKEANLREKYSMFRNDTLLQYPTSVTAERLSVNEVKVSWNKVPDAEYYRIYISEPSSGSYYQAGSYSIPNDYLGSIPLMEYKNSAGVNKWAWKEGDCLSIYTSDNSSYYVVVTSVKGDIESEFSDTVEVNPFKFEIKESDYPTYADYLVHKYPQFTFKDSNAFIDSFSITSNTNSVTADINIKGIENFDILTSNLLSLEVDSSESAEKVQASKNTMTEQLNEIATELYAKYQNKAININIMCDFESMVYFPLTKQKVHYDAENDLWIMTVKLLTCSKTENNFKVNWLLDKESSRS